MSPRPAGLPHPKEDQIRELLAAGATDAEVCRQLRCGATPVRRIRAAAGIPPVQRSAWKFPPHPKEAEIRELLAANHTNAEISRRTGADVNSIARRRRAGGFGPAPVSPPPRRWPNGHPKEAEIRALLATCSSAEIARRLHADASAVRRIRREAGITYVPPRFATPEEKWESLVRPVDGGHLEWLGERGGRGGRGQSPVMRFRGKCVSPAGIAFTKRTGRPPVGMVRAECDYPECIAPACVEDEPGRTQYRAQLRAIHGLPAPPPICANGHDQAVEGRYEKSGSPYCRACKADRKRTARPKTKTTPATSNH